MKLSHQSLRVISKSPCSMTPHLGHRKSYFQHFCFWLSLYPYSRLCTLDALAIILFKVDWSLSVSIHSGAEKLFLITRMCKHFTEASESLWKLMLIQRLPTTSLLTGFRAVWHCPAFMGCGSWQSSSPLGSGTTVKELWVKQTKWKVIFFFFFWPEIKTF